MKTLATILTAALALGTLTACDDSPKSTAAPIAATPPVSVPATPAVTTETPIPVLNTRITSEAKVEAKITDDAKAFALGSELATGLWLRALGADKVASEGLRNAEALAATLDVELPEYPELRGERAERCARALGYLLRDEGQRISRRISRGASDRAASLFELGVKSSLMMVLYVPGDDLGKTTADTVERLAKNNRIPSLLWQNAVDAVREGKTQKEVVAETFKMQTAIKLYLCEI